MPELLAPNDATTTALETNLDVVENAVQQAATDRVRVLHVINGEHYSGAERVQDLLAGGLPAEGFDVAFACVKPDRFPKMCSAKRAPIHELPMRSMFDMRVVWRLAKIIRREGIQIIHAHTPRTALVGRLAAVLTRRPFVYHVHSPTSRDSTRRIQNWLNTRVERWSLKGASRLITVSASLARHMVEQGFRDDQIAEVPNGVPQADVSRDDMRPHGTWTLGTVALFRPRKGTEVLLEALAFLRKAGRDVRVSAIGTFETPEYEAELKQRAVDLGVEDFVEWKGFTRDVNSELAKLDLFVLPSLFGEGLPMVVLEAMAVGVPVVGTKVEGVPEAIRHGKDGVIAKPRDASDLARVIDQIISGHYDWSALRESAKQRHADQFSDRSMAAGVGQCYREVLAEWSERTWLPTV